MNRANYSRHPEMNFGQFKRAARRFKDGLLLNVKVNEGRTKVLTLLQIDTVQ